MKRFIDKYLFEILLCIVIFTAAILRLWDFAFWSLTNDELSAINRLRFDSLGEVIHQGVMLNDFHPAGIQVFLYYWIKLVGHSVFWIRLPFVLCGIGSVYVLYLIGKKWFGKNAAIIAASVFSVLIYTVLMSQLARPYSPGLLFVLLSVFYWDKILYTEHAKRIDYTLYSLFLALTAYTHNYSFLFVVILGLTGFFLVKPHNWKFYLASQVLASVLYLPHISIFLYQFGIGGIGGEKGWLGPPDTDWMGHFLFYAFNSSGWFIGVLILVLAAILLGNQESLRFNRKMWICLLFFMLPYLIAHLYSIFRNPILQYSTLYFSFPFLILLISSFWQHKSLITTGFVVLTICLSGIISVFTGIQQYRNYQFADFKSLTTDMIQEGNKHHKDRIEWALAVNHPNYVRFYYDLNKTPAPEFPVYSLEKNTELKQLVKMLDTCSSQYFGYARLKNAHSGIPDIIQGKFPFKVFQKTYAGKSELYIFSKDSTHQLKNKQIRVSHFSTSFEEVDERFHINLLSLDTIRHSGKFAYRMRTSDEWGPGITAKTGELGLRFPSVLKVELFARSESVLRDSPLVLSITNSLGETYVWASSGLEDFLKPGEWNKVILTVNIPHPSSIDDILKIFVWNKDRREIFIDDMQISFYQLEQNYP